MAQLSSEQSEDASGERGNWDEIRQRKRVENGGPAIQAGKTGNHGFP